MKKKGVTRMLWIICLLVVFAYIVMLFDTNSVMNEARSLFLGKPVNDISSDELLHRYDESDLIARTESPKIHLRLIRLFTLHNFKDGYIWILYDYEVRDGNGNIVTGSRYILSKWIIHKENSKWKVVKIYEDP